MPVILLLIAVAACGRDDPARHGAGWVGSATCGECHAETVRLVSGRAHNLALQPAGDSSISGAFDGSILVHFGDTTEFITRGGEWLVRTAGPDGRRVEYAITHVIGRYPLEQYLVRFPGGRYQVLPFAWDTRPAEAGGARWFHIYPDERVPPTDELHWTGQLQTWNYMCAECHVTRLSRSYDLSADAYRTSWRESGVQCEACHGPGGAHLAWARWFERDSAAARSADPTGRTGFAVDLGTRHGGWAFDSDAAIARRTEPLGWNAQTETCGACHARRETLVTEYVPGRPLLATHRPMLLDEGLYFADGQLQDEVYEYGSFVQSRMYRAGVTCSDCHNASTQEVPPGNLICAKCHQPTVYDTRAHHFHDPDSAGGSCVACHMAEHTYMVVDPRHDHSIRVPRPDLSLRIGSPNACTICHSDRTDEWATDAVARWYGRPSPARHYGDVLHAGRRGELSADTALIRLAADTAEAGMVRATAVSLLNRYPSPVVAVALERAAQDPEPLVRLAAVLASDVLPPEARLKATSHLLSDSLLAIRVEAARMLAELPVQSFTPAQLAAFDEFVAVQRVNADQPESHLRLGLFRLMRGQFTEAERAYRDAIRIRPQFAAGYLNLADLYRAQGRDADGERVLRDGLRVAHHPAVLHHSLGLLLVRRRALEEALVELRRAVELAPDVPRFAQVWAVALHTAGQTPQAIRVLEDALRRMPSERTLAETLASIRGN